MNSALVLCAYFAMVLSPCLVAQCGDLFNLRWIIALARRRRTHWHESFLTSFRHERYAMAVALEAHFASMAHETFALPKPFLVTNARPAAARVETPAFIEARQRVAARIAQLAVAQKLRNETQAQQKVVAIPADVPAETLAAVFGSQLVSSGSQLRPRKPYDTAVHIAAREPVYETVPAVAAYASEALVFREAAPPLHSADVVPIAGSRPGSEASLSQAPRESTDSLEIAA